MPSELAESTQPVSMMAVIARAAADPSIDMSKMTALLDMQERIMAKNAEIAFNAALSRLAGKLADVKIVRTGSVSYKDKQSGKVEEAFKFAPYEVIDAAIRPLLVAEGFSLSFNSEAREGGGAVITGVLSHTDGHSSKASLPLALDSSGGKNNIQGMGSTISYGKRYTVGMLLNIVTVGEDVGEDDNGAGDDDILSNENAVEIDLLITKVKADKDKFLKFMGVDDVRLIRKTDYQKAITALNAKGGKK